MNGRNTSAQPAEPAEGERITLALTGDVMLGRLVAPLLETEGPRFPWGDVLPLLRDADLTIVNLECVIARGGRPWLRWPKVFHFRAGPAALDALAEAGIDLVTLANNHVLDYEEEALLEMLGHLAVRGIAYAGAGRDRAEAERPALLVAKGLRVGVLAFTDNEPGWAATERSPGINYLPVTTDEGEFARVRRGIADLRSRGADIVIFTNHWGPNMRLRPSDGFRRFAHAVIDAGADVYVGHSAHVLQGVELYAGRPIFYDLGDCVDDYAVDPALRNDLSAVAVLTVSKHGVERIELVPIAIDFCRVNLARGPDFAFVAERTRLLSQELGCELRQVGERLVVAAAAAQAA